jgi:hypothetical protein
MKTSNLVQAQNTAAIEQIATDLPVLISNSIDGQINIDNSSIVTSIQSSLAKDFCAVHYIRKLHENKTTTDGDIVTVYDDDGVTVLRQLRVSDTFREPIGENAMLANCEGYANATADKNDILTVTSTVVDAVFNTTEESSFYTIQGEHVYLGSTRDIFLADENVQVFRNGILLNKETEMTWISTEELQISGTLLEQEVITIKRFN